MGHGQTQAESPRRGADARFASARAGSGHIGTEALRPGSQTARVRRGRNRGGGPRPGDPPGAGLSHLTTACRDELNP